MNFNIFRKCITALLLACGFSVSAQRIALKTNTIDWALMSPNLTLETRLSQRLTFDLGVAGNMWDKTLYSSDITLKNFRIMPELRYWFNRPMARHFVGLAVTGGTFDIQWHSRRYRGDILAAGVTYGYALVLGQHWNVEFSLGLGLGNLWGYKFRTDENQPEDRNLTKWTPVPIRTGISFSYIFK